MRVEPLRINHVLSSKARSHIFDAILGYFNRHAGSGFRYVVSERPVEGAQAYHYHRPHLEPEDLRPPAVVTVHQDPATHDGALEFELFRRPYSQAAALVCLNSRQECFLRRQGFDRTTVIPHGYNRQVFATKKTPDKRDGLLRIGVFSKRYVDNFKGDEYILELFRRLPRDRFSFFFVGENRRLSQTEAERYGFASEFFEHLPYRLYDQLYRAIDVLLVPSHREGGPASLPEAAASGTPVLARDIAMASDYLVEGENGFFIGDDIEKDCRLLVALADNADGIWDRLAGRIAAAAVGFPTWEAVVKRYEDLYETLCGGEA